MRRRKATGEGDQGGRFNGFYSSVKNIFFFFRRGFRSRVLGFNIHSGRAGWIIGWLVGDDAYLEQEEEKERRDRAMAREGKRKEIAGERERLPNGRVRPTLASRSPLQQQPAAPKQQREEVESMISTVQDLLRPA